MRPVVKPALRRVWRDATTLQIGVHHARSVVVGGITAKTAQLMATFDGAHDAHALRRAAGELGLEASTVDRLLAMLDDAAVLDDAGSDVGALATLPRTDRDRIAPDLASLSLVSGRHDGGVGQLAGRRAATIGVVGAGRVGGAVATLVAAAGVGHVVVDDPATCRPSDCGPAGASIADVGSTRAQATQAAIHRTSRSTLTKPLHPTERHDIVVLAGSAALDPAVSDDLVRSDVPHIKVIVREAMAVVGPLVLPGMTACFRCLELARTDRDPAWPLIAAQLASDGPHPTVEACDVALATLAASVCALQVLTYLDGGTAAACDGTLEIALPDWRIRRRSWRPHPACGCCWPDRAWANGENLRADAGD